MAASSTRSVSKSVRPVRFRTLTGGTSDERRTHVLVSQSAEVEEALGRRLRIAARAGEARRRARLRYRLADRASLRRGRLLALAADDRRRGGGFDSAGPHRPLPTAVAAAQPRARRPRPPPPRPDLPRALPPPRRQGNTSPPIFWLRNPSPRTPRP